MNKLFKSIISIIGLSMAFAGCVGDFDDMNTDPNNPTPGSVDPKFQLIFIQGRGIPYANQWQQIDQLMIVLSVNIRLTTDSRLPTIT